MPTNNRRHSTTSQRSSNGRGYSSNNGTRTGNGRTAGSNTSSARSTTGSTRPGNARTSSGRTAPAAKRAAAPQRSAGANVAGMMTIIIVMIIVLAGITGAIVWTNVKYLYDDTRVIPGVEVEGVNIGGMTEQEAYNVLSQKLDEKINKLSITIRYNEQYWTYDAASLNASGDISGIVAEAMKYGHKDGMKLKDRMDEAEYVLNNPEVFDISFSYDVNAITQIVNTLKSDIDVPAVESTLEFDKEAGKITGIDDLWSLNYNPLKYDNTINVNGLPGEIYIDANGNLQIKADIFTITQGSSGVEVDAVSTVNAIITDLSDDSVADVNLIVNQVNPLFTEADLTECTSLVYHSKSKLASSSTPNRDHNVALALEAFDGLVIMPGQTISFNETTGERSQANGYLLAPTIAQDKSHKEDWGGGVCQAATIIFNAAIMSGCEILDKDSHSWPLYTAADDFGSDARDAMVNWGTSDLVFKNNTEYPIYFDTYSFWNSPDNMSHGYCNAYTKLLPTGQSIVYDPRLTDFKEAPEPEYKALTDLSDYADSRWRWNEELGLLTYEYAPSKPMKYYDVYQRIIDEQGNLISEQLWYRSHYDAITGLYYTKPDPDREDN